MAIMGPLAAASVELYPLSGLAGPPVYKTTTSDGNDVNQVGLFLLPKELVEADAYYLIKVSGGWDRDADDDGVIDSSSTPSRGSVHAVLSGTEIQAGNFHVSPLTEVIYQRLRYLLAGDYPLNAIRDEIRYRAVLMLKGDVDGDNDVDADDVVAWHPRRHRELLRHGWSRYAPLIAAIHRGEEPVAAALDVSQPIIGRMSTRKGTAYDVAVAGRYAYEVDETNLMVIDVARPEAPTLLATLPMGAARAVAVADGVAYVANGAGGLKIVDVRAPALPRLMATVAGLGNVADVAVSDDLAYVAGDAATLSVVDISNPAAPVAIGGLALGQPYQQAIGVAVMGKYALVAVEGGGLMVVDATEPTALRKVAQLASNITALAVQGSHAYVADLTRGLLIVDLSNPVQPVVTAELTMPYTRSITVSGAHAYLSTGGLSIVNIEKPALPQLVGFIDGMSGANGSDVSNGWVYVADSNDGLHIVAPDGAVHRAVTKTTVVADGAFDYGFGNFFSYTVNGQGLTALEAWEAESQPLAPRPRSFKLDLWGGAQALDVQNSYVYLASGQQGFRAVASSGMNRPRLEGELGVTWNQAVASQGDIAYTLRTGAGLEVLDIKDPARPVKVGAFSTGIEGRGLALRGNILFAIDGSLGLTVLDVSDATAPRRLSQWNAGIEPWAIAVANDYVYIVDRAGLAIIEVSDLSQPRIIGRYRANPLSAQVAVQGDRVYMAINDTLSVIDVADPANPSLLSAFVSPDHIAGLAPAGMLVYMTTLNSGMIVLDVHDVSNPIVKGTWKPLNSPHAIYATGNRVYAADGQELYIVDVRNPAAPALIGHVLTGAFSYSQQISIAGTKAFIAAGSAGLRVVDFSDEKAPYLQGRYIVSPSNITDVAAAGDIVYAADRDLGVLVIDVSTAARPTLRAAMPLVHGADRLVVEGKYVYALNGWTLSVVDMSDRDAPRLVAELPALGARAVLMHAGLIYIATVSDLMVVDVAAPARPVLRDRIYLPIGGLARDLAAHGDVIYMTMASGGLQAFDVKEPVRPRWLAATSIPGSSYRATATAGGIYVTGGFGVSKLRPLAHGLP